MAHFAELNDSDIVQRVIVVNNNILLDSNDEESEQLGINFCNSLFGGKWIQTSYNGSFRDKFAGIGYQYDSIQDIFINLDSA